MPKSLGLLALLLLVGCTTVRSTQKNSTAVIMMLPSTRPLKNCAPTKPKKAHKTMYSYCMRLFLKPKNAIIVP